jgi:glycolate oxidase iron-sulfur subunit
MLRLLPDKIPRKRPLPEVHPAEGATRARVALLVGCGQQVLAPDINWATLRVLARNGIETVIPRGQACCGALAMHTGASEQAKPLARKNLRAFPDDVDAIVTNAAGCGSGLREYELLFKGEPEQDAGARLAARTVDVSVFLAGIGLREAPPPLAHPTSVAYQDACHLAHAQGVRGEPRSLLRAIPGLRLVEPTDWALCCGSAGMYNIEKPGTADELGRRKATSLSDTGAELVATGNFGCMAQVQTHLRALGRPALVLHTMQVLDRAYNQTLTEKR